MAALKTTQDISATCSKCNARSAISSETQNFHSCLSGQLLCKSNLEEFVPFRSFAVQRQACKRQFLRKNLNASSLWFKVQPLSWYKYKPCRCSKLLATTNLQQKCYNRGPRCRAFISMWPGELNNSTDSKEKPTTGATWSPLSSASFRGIAAEIIHVTCRTSNAAVDVVVAGGVAACATKTPARRVTIQTNNPFDPIDHTSLKKCGWRSARTQHTSLVELLLLLTVYTVSDSSALCITNSKLTAAVLNA